MYKETARRIKEGLLASLEGGSLHWLQGYQAPNPLLHNVDPEKVAAARAPAAQSGEKSGEKGAVKGSLSNAKPGGKAIAGGGSAPIVSAAAVSAAESSGIYNFEYATGFLKDGFEELVKCRSVSVLARAC
jgi:hypothetical protein